MAVVIGIIMGLIGYLSYISKAYSYLSDNPKTCVNCHVMASEYATWFHSAHGRVTVCNDCHVPQDNFFKKYYFKAADGLRHATYFAMRWEPQVIRMGEQGAAVVQKNCMRCHSTLNSAVGNTLIADRGMHGDAGKLCWECHREVPHGKIRGLSAAPNARVPLVQPPVPHWLEKMMKNNTSH